MWIFDLDGTLALIDHRRRYVEGKDKDWDAFNLACVDDDPNSPVINVLRCLERSGDTIVIYSGRDDTAKDQTKEWLAEHDIPYHRLRMRPHGDFTPDEELKLSWALEENGETIDGVFDDRQKIVDMWRANGLTCFQVAKGDF